MEVLKQQLKQYFTIEEESPGVYTTNTSWVVPGGGSIYGGQLLSQALASAILTLSADFSPHSLHCYFILGGQTGIPLYYYVDRVRDGKSFATRVVNCKQAGKTIFTLSASFQKPSSGDNAISHQYSMPDVYPVDSGEFIGNSSKTHDNMYVGDFVIDQKIMAMETMEFDSRLAVPKDPVLRKDFDLGVNEYIEKIQKSDSKTDKSQIKLPINYRWVRIGNIHDVHPTVHLCLLASLSDFRLLMTAALPHLWGYNYDKNELSMRVSLDHSIHFHTPIKSDEWHLWVVESSRVSSERGYTSGRFYDQNGVLVASTVQEILFRAKPVIASAANNIKFSVPHPVLEQKEQVQNGCPSTQSGASSKL